MNGTIYCNSAEEVVTFLRALVGCTATFEVTRHGSNGWKIVFLGGF